MYLPPVNFNMSQDGKPEARQVNIHYQVSMLSHIDTSAMVWHAQIFCRGSWKVHRNSPDAMTEINQKLVTGFPPISEFDRLLEWGEANTADFSKNCIVKHHTENDAMMDFLTIFNPQFYFVNLLGKRSEAVQETTVEVLKLGNDTLLCMYSQRILGDFATEMKLEAFPWDNTSLEIELMTQWDDRFLKLADQQAVEPNRKHLLSETAKKYSPVEWDLYDHGLNAVSDAVMTENDRDRQTDRQTDRQIDR